nr:MAG: hypothetical protein H4Bulk46330_000002 [Mitovirus sp.]
MMQYKTALSRDFKVSGISEKRTQDWVSSILGVGAKPTIPPSLSNLIVAYLTLARFDHNMINPSWRGANL